MTPRAAQRRQVGLHVLTRSDATQHAEDESERIADRAVEKFWAKHVAHVDAAQTAVSALLRHSHVWRAPLTPLLARACAS